MSTSLPDMTTLAPAIAAELGPDWTAQPDLARADELGYVLRHSDGRGIELSVVTWETDRNYGRLHAQAALPEQPEDVHIDTTDIERGQRTMAGTKTARQIAREIARDLLPTVTIAHARWHARAKRLRAEEAQRSATAARLATLPGMGKATPATWRHGYEVRKLHLAWDGAPRGEGNDARRHSSTPSARVLVDVDHDGETVEITLSHLFSDQAERVLRALLEPEQPDLSDLSLTELLDQIEDAARHGYTLTEQDRAAVACARNPSTDNGEDDVFFASTGTVGLPEYILTLARRSRASKQP